VRPPLRPGRFILGTGPMYLLYRRLGGSYSHSDRNCRNRLQFSTELYYIRQIKVQKFRIVDIYVIIKFSVVFEKISDISECLSSVFYQMSHDYL
jgi:hypothetical protein